MRIRPRHLVILAVGLSLAACTSPAAPTPAPAVENGAEDPAGLTLSSPDLDAEGYLPDWAIGAAGGFCSGENRSPRLEWSTAPDGTAGFAVTMTDPNYPSYTHWIVTGIPASDDALESTPGGLVANGVLGTSGEGESTGGPGIYVGPCVVDNGYLYTVYALDEALVGDSATTFTDFASLIDGHVLEQADLEVKRH